MGTDNRVGNVFQIPGQQIIDTVDCGYGNMQRIFCCLPGDCFFGNKSFSQSNSIRSNFKQWQPIDHFEPFCDRISISRTDFLNNRLRNIYTHLYQLLFPPLLCGLLIGSNDQIPTRTRCQIADHAGHKIDFQLHKSIIHPCTNGTLKTRPPRRLDTKSAKPLCGLRALCG